MQIRAAFAHCAAPAMFAGILAACVQKSPAPSADAASLAVPPPSTVAAQKPPAPTSEARPHGDPEVERACTDICQRSVQLKCSHSADCMVNCLAMGTVTPCTTEMTAFYQCLLKQPAKNWECDDQGVAAIRPGFCEKEQEKTVLCMDKKVKP